MPIVLVPRGRVPAAPSLTSVTAGAGGAIATWTAPITDGGSPVTGYLVSAVNAVDGSLALTVSTGSDATSATLAPLTNDTAYSITVVALNGVGASAQSSPTTVTPTVTAPPVTPPVVVVPPVVVPRPQPALAAFPVNHAFHPDNWLLSAEEASA